MYSAALNEFLGEGWSGQVFIFPQVDENDHSFALYAAFLESANIEKGSRLEVELATENSRSVTILDVECPGAVFDESLPTDMSITVSMRIVPF